jgi:hypothetical protein
MGICKEILLIRPPAREKTNSLPVKFPISKSLSVKAGGVYNAVIQGKTIDGEAVKATTRFVVAR